MLDNVEYSDLRSLLRSTRNEQIFDGCSGVEVYYLPELSAYLKIGETGKIYDLHRERAALLWLADRVSVPKVLGFESDNRGDVLLISETAGTPASKYVTAVDNERAVDFVRNAARAMRQIHSIDIRDCPLDQRLDEKLTRAGENVRRGLVDISDFENENAGKTAGEIYDEVLKERPAVEDLVFTHGDLCLPNIMVEGGRIAGFIDLGLAGVADRYHDIALFERSFRRNCRIDIDFERAFCEAYSVIQIDRTKLAYYRKLDELY